MKLPIDQIRIGERQRLSIGDLSDLDSMDDPEVGLIQPIVVHKTLEGYELVAGRRRLAKATSLGWKDIEVLEKDTLPIVQKNKMELFEDVGRTDRPWQDRCLSIAKLHYLMKSEKGADGEAWTTKHTSIATGFGAGATIIRKMLAVAELLAKEPRDQEAWDSANFSEAYRTCIVDRNERDARAELERRRSLMNQLVLPETQSGAEPTWADGEIPPEGEESPGHIVTLTEARPNKVWIHGTNMDFEKALPNVHFAEHGYYGVLSYGVNMDPQWVINLFSAIRPEGFAVLWVDQASLNNRPSFLNSSQVMNWHLIWNQIAIKESQWPFSPNYGTGFVVSGKKNDRIDNINPASSVISAMPQEDGVLPSAVVNATIKACVPPNMAVLLIGSIDPIDVIETGRVPVWFEPDKEKYDAKVLALTKYYEETIPGVEVNVK